MFLDLTRLPTNVKLEVSKGDLEAFANHILQNAEPHHGRPFAPPSPVADKEILSVMDAADLTGFAKQTIYAKIHKREIPFYKTGRKVVFKRSELEAWLFGQKSKTVAELRAEAMTMPFSKRAQKTNSPKNQKP